MGIAALDSVVELVVELMAKVDRVVAEEAAGAIDAGDAAGGWPIAPMLVKDPAPQRHAQLQEPSGLRVPVP